MQYSELLTLTTAILLNGTTKAPDQVSAKDIEALLAVAKRIVTAASHEQSHP
jgi:hypothetical protein